MFALLMIAGHMMGDYVFQTPWIGMRKLKDWKVRTLHVFLYTLCFIPIPLIAQMSLTKSVLFLVCIFIPHWIIDCRRWCEEWVEWYPRAIMWDQSFHAVHLATVAVIFQL